MKYLLALSSAYLVPILSAGSLQGAAQPDLVDVRTTDASIVVELRYASDRNLARRALYPAEMPALVRPEVAVKLRIAQQDLRRHGYGLKIWDAYRPRAAQEQLWQLYPDKNYVADASQGFGSMHTWGLAVDATLVESSGAEVAMPTDFDEFTPAAMLIYAGKNKQVRSHLWTLQRAMGKAGFLGMRTEWWHFVAKEWSRYVSGQGTPKLASVQQEGSRRATISGQ